MPLTITNVTRENGATCDHVQVRYDHEGVSRTFTTSFTEIDQLGTRLGPPIEVLQTLVSLWAQYRRREGRTVVNVTIA